MESESESDRGSIFSQAPTTPIIASAVQESEQKPIDEGQPVSMGARDQFQDHSIPPAVTFQSSDLGPGRLLSRGGLNANQQQNPPLTFSSSNSHMWVHSRAV